MPSTTQDILAAADDVSLIKLLGNEIKARMSKVAEATGGEVDALRALPEGLRAMASIYSLDVSITLDDLVWHFFNHHDHELAAETLRGLQILGAYEAASIFAEAYMLVSVHWEAIGRQRTAGPDTWFDAIEAAGLDAAVAPLNQRMRDLCSSLGRYGLLQYWLLFARSHPSRVFASS